MSFDRPGDRPEFQEREHGDDALMRIHVETSLPMLDPKRGLASTLLKTNPRRRKEPIG